MPGLEENLAREMAKMKMEKEKNQRELEKICQESPELRELQNKIKSAYLNKERATQVTESQYRKQAEVVSNATFIFYIMHTFFLNSFFLLCFYLRV
jgi:hypothetical protein